MLRSPLQRHSMPSCSNEVRCSGIECRRTKSHGSGMECRVTKSAARGSVAAVGMPLQWDANQQNHGLCGTMDSAEQSSARNEVPLVPGSIGPSCRRNSILQRSGSSAAQSPWTRCRTSFCSGRCSLFKRYEVRRHSMPLVRKLRETPKKAQDRGQTDHWKLGTAEHCSGGS
jgi:hypothetical protein